MVEETHQTSSICSLAVAAWEAVWAEECLEVSISHQEEEAEAREDQEPILRTCNKLNRG